jgi:iron complex transport system substrate-binding protein
MKIWSLLPGATEILFALGLGEEITGVTHECDYPPQANSKPRVTVSHVDSSRPGGDIDRQVTERFQAGQRLYGVAEARLQSDPPDLIVTQDLCPVCAVSPSDLDGHLESAGCSAEVVCLNPRRLTDVLDDVRRLGDATGHVAEADQLRTALSERLESVREAVGVTSHLPRILCLEWLDPPMPAGHWVPDMIALAGGDDGGVIPPGEVARKVSWNELDAIEPEIVVLMPCGFSSERAGLEGLRLWDSHAWRGLPAVRSGAVFAVDGNAYFSRPGPRLTDGVELLAHILHPDLFPKTPPLGSVLKLVSPPAGASSVENWTPRFEPLLMGVS